MKAYTLKVTLVDMVPPVWRRAVVPAEISFQRLHEVIQCLMLWDDYHMFEFCTPDDKYRFVGDQETIDDFNAHIEDMDPKPQWQYKLASKTKIDSLLSKQRQLHYIYDFGDSWEVLVELEGTQEDYKKPYAACLDGENPAPPEDVGGIDGYRDFLEAVNDPYHDRHEELLEWSEGWQQKFNKRRINAGLRELILKRMIPASKK
jgi:hypothetical protein